MVSISLQLTEDNKQKLDELSRQTGKTPDELANEALERFAEDAAQDEQRKFQEWRKALLRLKGIWKDRTDLPDFEALRKSWDRDIWSR